MTHDGPIHLVVDSTGLKLLGDGEWHTHRHKTSSIRRAWRKLHLGIDADGVIVASELADSAVGNASVGVTMIEQVVSVIGRFTADGAYDRRAIYIALAASGTANIRIVIPPMKTATVDPRATGPWRQRNDAIKRIAEVGRRQWRKESGVHRQARAENGMYRYKRIIGDGLRARKFKAQWREALIAVNVLNRMTELGIAEKRGDCGVRVNNHGNRSVVLSSHATTPACSDTEARGVNFLMGGAEGGPVYVAFLGIS